MKKHFYILLILIFPLIVKGQFSINSDLENLTYSTPKDYEIAGVTVQGADFFDSQAIISLSGLLIGNTIKIPGEKISRAIKSLWEQKLFSDVKIYALKIDGIRIFPSILSA